MNEGLKQVNDLLRTLNETFEIEANVKHDEDGEYADGLKIKSLQNDGGEFLATFHDMFNELVKAISPEHEVIYDVEHGLVIARKVTEFVIEKF